MELSKVCKLGFGTSQIGGPSLIAGRLTGAKAIPKTEAINILKYAFDNGINFFDTSDKYGNAEELLGETFSAIREKVVIATKCGLTEEGERDFSIAYIKKCIDSSLSRLKSDYIDIFQLAKPKIQEISQELLVFFEEEIKKRRVRHFGISIVDSNDGGYYLTRKTISSLQIFHNLLFPQNHNLIQRTAQAGKFVIIRSPLNSGMLSGRYTRETKFNKVDGRSEIFQGDLLKKRLEMVEKIKARFSLSAKDVLGFSLNFILSNKDVNVVIPAASRIEQVKDYLRIYKGEERFREDRINDILYFLNSEFYAERSV